MQRTSADPGASPSDSPACGGAPPQATDPLADLVGHLKGTWQALRSHGALVVDEAIGRFYGFLLTAAMVVAGMCIVILLMTLGCYYLVSGIALGMTHLVGSVWIGNAIAGSLFLVAPALIGFCVALGKRRAREQRMVSAYGLLQEQAAAT
jgi:hypothetical protein